MEDTNIIKLNDGTYKCFVQHHTAANNINKRLRQYLDGKVCYKFQEGEEAVFYFNTLEMKFIQATMTTFKCL